MKINFSSLICFKIRAFLLVLLLNNTTPCSSNGLRERKACSASNKYGCIIQCRGWNMDLERGELNEILKAVAQRFQNCSLILEACSHTNATWREINPDEEPKIVDLKIFNSLVDLNQLNLGIFRNLRTLKIKNTTTVNLRSEMFVQLPRLQSLRVQKNNYIKWVDKGFLQNLTLEFLQIQGLNLDQKKTKEFFRNLTSGHEIPTIQMLDWSHNNFGNFSKDLLAPFPNLRVLVLTNSSISSIEDGTFTTGNIKSVFINQNKIQKLPEKVFGPLLEKASSVSLQGNNLTCDCETKWLQKLVKRRVPQKFQINCAHPPGIQILDAAMCPEVKSKEEAALYCTSKNNSETPDNHNLALRSIQFPPVLDDDGSTFTITEEKPGLIEVEISKTVATDGFFLWYGNYANATTPKFNCLKVLQQKFSIHVTPDSNYLICLAMTNGQHFHCLPHKTMPRYENQPWLTNKSMSLSIISIFVAFLFALAIGALILYLSVLKNPSLIRGSKRVIEVKRHDKAQLLIMPRGYESASQGDPSSLMLLNPRLEPSRSTLSCDTISTVSYISAHQPTQLEILTYRLSRLRELFQRNNNNLPPPVPRIQMQLLNQRLPPDVDLLIEYEWYTITTTTTTQM